MLAIGKFQTSAHKRYAIRTWAFMAPYVLVNVGAIFGAFDDIRSPVAAWALALVVSAPVVGQIWATLALMSESDEFVRALVARQFIVAAGVAMALFSVWGFGESYAHAPHAPGWLIYPLFWGAFGVVSPFIRSTR
ncbi:hypothetical protein [Caulobacter hibisci]|uniref:Uncharacterized protein n=1 Tax=Caulobacter hibisci TaxID=2035993 RepID=A0ABS0SYL3_9CAUL|nr:hypothetical protein [Caulobacter hibisci]MBI1684713.1 hypothetical protein [Caulobacter hibisci]